MRGIHTIGLRVPKQMSNAAKLAAALEQDPHVTKVNHPSLESFPQHELATRLFKGDQMSAMMSIIVPEDLDKMDQVPGQTALRPLCSFSGRRAHSLAASLHIFSRSYPRRRAS